MISMALPQLRRSDDDRVVAGVCAGIADALGVDPTLVRLVFAVLALAGGAGIVLYIGALLYMNGRGWIAVVALLVAVSLALGGLGLSDRTVGGIALVAGGLVLIWRRGGSFGPGATLSLAGLALVAAGAVLVLSRGGSTALLTPGAIVGALLLIVVPWLWRVASERAERIRLEERADMAARVHDSVLQTLTLIQRHSAEPRRVASLARRQERELRGWLYGDGATTRGDTLVGALAQAAAEIEDLHGVRVELASGGDCPADDEVRAVVLAAREAMQNAAKFSGAEEISVYAEYADGRVNVFVRDRGAGFSRAEVPPDRHGLSESIEGRMARAGGSATVVSSPGAGTEVELTLPRRSA
jgi:signal transduction histidine kinase